MYLHFHPGAAVGTEKSFVPFKASQGRRPRPYVPPKKSVRMPAVRELSAAALGRSPVVAGLHESIRRGSTPRLYGLEWCMRAFANLRSSWKD